MGGCLSRKYVSSKYVSATKNHSFNLGFIFRHAEQIKYVNKADVEGFVFQLGVRGM